jgi:hypothetical protein
MGQLQANFRASFDPPGRRLIAGCDDSLKRSVTADIMARAREMVLVMGREDNSPVRVRCGKRPAGVTRPVARRGRVTFGAA